MIIDVHTHAFGEQIAERTMSKLRDIIGRPPEYDGTVPGLKKAMAEAGIDHAVVLVIATKPSQHNTINAWAASQDGGNITAFGSVHPACEDPYAELVRIKDLGLKGIKIHPDYQGTEIDDPSYRPIFEGAQALGLIIEFHCGWDSVSPDHIHNSPDRLRKVLDDFPRLKVIGGHLGGHRMWDAVEEYLVGRDICLETSMCPGRLDPVQLRRICDKHNPDRLLFGTDAPWKSMRESIDYVQSLALPGERAEKLFSGNARRLLGV